MDYEKEYKSLIAKVKKAHQFAQTDSTKSVLEDILPQLRESEDERIRKGLIEVVSDIAGCWPFEEHRITKKEALAYLERQKEQKPIEDVIKNITKNKEAAIKFLKSAGIMDDNGELAEMYRSEQKLVDYDHEMWRNCEANFEGGKKEVIEHPEKYGLQKEQKLTISDEAIREGIVHFGITQYQIDNWLKKHINIIKQKEQNPKIIIPKFHIGEYIKPKPYNEKHLIKSINEKGYILDIDFVVPFKDEDVWEVVEQKSAEWSKDEQDKLNRIYHILGQAADTHAFSTTCRLIGDKEAVELQDFLRSIAKPEVKPAEWSEEDEGYMGEIIRIINRETALYPKGGATEDLNNDLIAWLKSLRHSWKPSEEQMEALETAERWYSDNMGCNLTLVSLVEQLKKL